MSFLVLDGVGKRYGAVVALDGVGLVVERGSRTAIVGPSGSGKTSLLRVIAGFEAPDVGRVSLDGAVVAEGGGIVPAHRRGVGLVAQDGALFPHLSVEDNIAFGLERGAPGRRRRVDELMALVELEPGLRRRRPDELSGGQQQRVALARAMAREPRLMLLDEPFSALDTGLRASTRKAVSEVLARAGITTVLVTHDQAEALSFADQLGVMRGGRLLQVGPPRELYARPADRGIAEFLGEAIMLPANLAGGVARCALGALAVDGSERGGAATVMLRPEQIALVPDAAAACAQAEVLEIDFGGAACTYAVRLLSGETLSIRQGSAVPLAKGSVVGVVVTGRPHVFAER